MRTHRTEGVYYKMEYTVLGATMKEKDIVV